MTGLEVYFEPGHFFFSNTSLLYHLENKGFTDQRLAPIIIDVQGIEDEKDFYATGGRRQ